MKDKIKTAIAMVAGILCSVCLADVRIWGGGSGKWSVGSNWEGGIAPQNGDTVEITSGMDTITVENDIPNLQLDKMRLLQADGSTAPIVLTGEKLTFTKIATVIEATCLFTNSMPLVFADNTHNNPSVSASKGCVFLGDIEALGLFFVGTVANINVDFLGRVHGENALIRASGANNTYRFYAPVDVKGLIGSDSWCTCIYQFYAAGNSWTTNDLSYGCSVYAYVDNAFPSNMVMRWKECRTNNDEGASYIVMANQTIDRIETAPPEEYSSGSIRDAKFQIRQTDWQKFPTLTLRATASASCYARMVQANANYRMAFVYDPVGDYTQTFIDRVHTISEKMTVRGGTLESRGNNTFASVKELEISSGARFKVSANESGVAVNPFSGGVTEAVVAYGGVLEVCGGVTMTLKKLRANGVCVPVGTYQALDGTDPDAEKVSWVEGAGLVSVVTVEDATCWKAAVSGSWNDAANWTAGVPTSSKTTYVTVGGADYTVTVPSGATLPKDMTVGNSRGTTCVSFTAGNHAISSWNWTVDEGGVMDVPAEANVICNAGNTANAAVNVKGGGEFRVSGGDIVFTNANSLTTAGFVVAGENSLTGRVTVTAGAFRYVPYLGSTFNLNEGGLLDLQGGVFHVPTMTSAAGSVFKQQGGVIRATSGEFRTAGGDRWGWPSIKEPGAEFGGNSVFVTYNDDQVTVSPSAAGNTARLEFSGTAAWTNRCSTVNVGGSAGGRSILSFDSDAAHGSPVNGVNLIASAVNVGIDSGYGELDVKKGYVPVYANGLTVGRASDATKTTDGVEGMAKISGGSLYLFATANFAGYGDSLLGLVAGNGGRTAVRSGHPYVGTVELTGGSITNHQGTTVFGMGYGRGTFRQSGGVYRANAALPVAVGMGGGIGSVEISGGEFITASANADVYVGGVGTNAFGAKVPDLAAVGYPIDRHDAQGTLSFSGGSLSVAGSVVLGADGTGVFERIGMNGTIAIGKDLVFSNTVENAQSGGTLAFKLDDSAKVGPIDVAGKVVIDSNAKLTVDTGDMPHERIRCTLLAARGGVEGVFAAGSVTFTGADAHKMQTRWRPDGSFVCWKSRSITISFR